MLVRHMSVTAALDLQHHQMWRADNNNEERGLASFTNRPEYNAYILYAYLITPRYAIILLFIRIKQQLYTCVKTVAAACRKFIYISGHY